MADMLKASDILDEPEIIDDIEGKYQIIHDESNTGFKFDKLNEAVCVMAEKGWRCLSINAYEAGFIRVMHALMEKLV